MEEELETERNTLNKIIDLNPCCIGVFDRDGHIVRWNQAFIDLCKAPPPKEYSMFDDPLLKKAGFQEGLLKLKEGETFRTPEMWYNTNEVDPSAPDNPLCVKVVSFPIMDGNGELQYVVNMAEDVTQRNLAEGSRRESEQQYRDIFESVTDCLFVVDAEGLFVEVNPAACRTYGYTREELIGRSALELIHPDYHHTLDDFVRQVSAGEGFYNQSVNVRKDGSAFYVDVWGVLFTFRGEKHQLAVIHDITERKQAEKTLQQQHQHLKRLLEVHEQNRKLVAYEIHDGVVQSLVGAKMFIEVASQSIDSQCSEEHRKNCQSGLRLLDEAIAQARQLMSGQRPPVLDEHGLVTAVEYLVSEEADCDGMKIDFTHDVEFVRLAPPLETALFRIVQESLANARHHSQSEEVHIGLTQQDGHVRVEVKDWGVGFDVENVTEECFGLHGIRERARLFGGNATIESRPGKGTRIAVELPLVED